TRGTGEDDAVADRLGTDVDEEVGVFEGQFDQVARGFDCGVLAEDIGGARGRHRTRRGLLSRRSIRRRSASEIESETDTDTAMASIGGGAEVGGQDLAVRPNPRRL